MTKVYRLEPDHTFRSLYMPNRAELSRSVAERHFTGQPIAANWQPITVAPVPDRDQRDLPLGTCAMMDGFIPVLSPGAVSALMPMLATNGELVPVNLLNVQWHAFNTTTLLDALDHDHSSVEYFAGTKRPMWIEHYVFRPGAITRPIFKLPDVSAPVFTTEEFKAAYIAARLTGFTFEAAESDRQQWEKARDATGHQRQQD